MEQAFRQGTYGRLLEKSWTVRLYVTIEWMVFRAQETQRTERKNLDPHRPRFPLFLFLNRLSHVTGIYGNGSSMG
jgi:hypothetical protein